MSKPKLIKSCRAEEEEEEEEEEDEEEEEEEKEDCGVGNTMGVCLTWKPKHSIKSMFKCHLCTTNLARTGPGMTPKFERPATNRLTHGTAPFEKTEIT